MRAVISLLLLCVGHSSGLTASTAVIGSKVAGTADVSPDAIMVVLHRILGHLQQVMDAAKVPLEPQKSPHGPANIVVSSPGLKKEAGAIVDTKLKNKVYSYQNYDQFLEAIKIVLEWACNFEEEEAVNVIISFSEKIEKLLNLEEQNTKTIEAEVSQIIFDEQDHSDQFIQNTLIPKLNQLDYEIKNVRGDGSCGFYSILQCLQPGNDFSKVQKYSDEWYLAAMLRLRIAQKSELHNLAEMTVATEENQMGANALPYVAKFYQQTVLMIDSTTPEFRVYSADKASNEIPYEIVDLDDLFSKPNSLEKTIILLYVPMHWKAIVKKIH